MGKVVKTHYDASGNVIGYSTDDGYHLDASGNRVGFTDNSGYERNMRGEITGWQGDDGYHHDHTGARDRFVDSRGYTRDMSRNIQGWTNSDEAAKQEPEPDQPAQSSRPNPAPAPNLLGGGPSLSTGNRDLDNVCGIIGCAFVIAYYLIRAYIWIMMAIWNAVSPYKYGRISFIIGMLVLHLGLPLVLVQSNSTDQHQASYQPPYGSSSARSSGQSGEPSAHNRSPAAASPTYDYSARSGSGQAGSAQASHAFRTAAAPAGQSNREPRPTVPQTGSGQSESKASSPSSNASQDGKSVPPKRNDMASGSEKSSASRHASTDTGQSGQDSAWRQDWGEKEEEKDEKARIWQTLRQVNLRDRPQGSAKRQERDGKTVIVALAKETEVEILEQQGEWALVRAKRGGEEGWLEREHLEQVLPVWSRPVAGR